MVQPFCYGELFIIFVIRTRKNSSLGVSTSLRPADRKADILPKKCWYLEYLEMNW